MQLPNNLASLQEALDKLPQKKITQAIIALLVCYIAYLLAQITWLLIPEPNNQNKAVLSAPNVQVSQNSSNFNLSAIKALNLFGQYNPDPVAEQPKIEVQDAPETRLNLKLSGVVSTQNEKTAAAIIENSGRQETYGIGDQITGTRASVEQILPDRVLIKQSGRLETLMLDGFEYSKTITQPQRQQNTASQNQSIQQATSASPASAKVVDQRKNRELRQQMTNLRADITKDPGKILDYLSISPVRPGGKIVGYRLSPGRKPQLFKAAGLRSGDIAVQMNGFDLTQAAEAGQALQALRQEQEVSLLIKRGDELTEILFSIGNI